MLLLVIEPFFEGNDFGQNNSINFYAGGSDAVWETVLDLKNQFQEQSDTMSSLIKYIENLEAQLEDISKKTGVRIQELELHRRKEEIKGDFKEIRKMQKNSLEAAIWLNKRREAFVRYALTITFDEQNQIRESHLSISQEGCEDFQRDIRTLISWIISSLASGGVTPKQLPKDYLRLPIDYKFYVKVFDTILDEVVCKEDRSNVSSDALQIVIDFFNRFLIDRECQI
jgi:hypothetical protein